jgi:hypothetical protein
LSFSNSTDFLKLIPDDARLEAYRLYVQCISTIVNPPAPASGPVNNGDSLKTPEHTIRTCFAEQDLSDEAQLTDIVMPLNCPLEADQGEGFRITGSYACGKVYDQKILFGAGKVPAAVEFSVRDRCRVDIDPTQARENCDRPDEPNYRAQHSCFVVGFRIISR